MNSWCALFARRSFMLTKKIDANLGMTRTPTVDWIPVWIMRPSESKDTRRATMG